MKKLFIVLALVFMGLGWYQLTAHWSENGACSTIPNYSTDPPIPDTSCDPGSTGYQANFLTYAGLGILSLGGVVALVKRV